MVLDGDHGLALTVGLALAALPSEPIVQWAGVVVLAGVVAWQPARIAASKELFRYPQYRAMRLGSIELARRAPTLRDICVEFAGAHPTMDKYFMYRILGGRIEPGAAIAFIGEGGRVTGGAGGRIARSR